MATTLHRRPIKVVTDSEDDQSDIRQRSDFHITSRRVSTVLEEKHEDKKKRQTYQGLTHTIPIHTLSKASVLSKEAPPENYNGFIRLGSKYTGQHLFVGTCQTHSISLVLVLGASNIRLIIENWMKYGLLIRLPHSYIPYQDYGLFVLAWLSVPLSLGISMSVEYAMAKLALWARDTKPDVQSKVAVLERVASAMHIIHLTFLLAYPSYIVYTKIYHPLGKGNMDQKHVGSSQLLTEL